MHPTEIWKLQNWEEYQEALGDLVHSEEYWVPASLFWNPYNQQRGATVAPDPPGPNTVSGNQIHGLSKSGIYYDASGVLSPDVDTPSPPKQSCSFCYEPSVGCVETYGGRQICPDCVSK